MRTAYITAGVILAGAVAWYLAEETNAVEAVATTLDDWTGGFMKLSDMAKVTAAHVANRNVRAFLAVIRRGEGTADAGGYTRLFGGEQFTSLADHPRRLVSKSGYKSTAAGAYQFLESTWDETRRVMGLTDFSQASQDRGAVGRIAFRGALADVLAGRFEDAVRKCAKEWASLPFSPYGQPTISLATAQTVYTNGGGVMA